MNEHPVEARSDGPSQDGFPGPRGHRGPRRGNSRSQHANYNRSRIHAEAGESAQENMSPAPSIFHSNSQRYHVPDDNRSRIHTPESQPRGGYYRGTRRQRPRRIGQSSPASHHAATRGIQSQIELESQDQPDSTFQDEQPPSQPESSNAARNRVRNAKPTPNVQSEILENKLRNNKFECLICCDIIYRSNAIWYCNNCYNIFHLKCAVEWCNKSINSRQNAIVNAQYPALGLASERQSSRNNPSDSGASIQYQENNQEYINQIEWPCPTCREVLYSRPNKYKCFCGKVIRPEVNRRYTPHSCGQMCGKKRPDFECPHKCDSLCHPGRCSPCEASSDRSCFCGKVTRDTKCAESGFRCDDACGKLLSCGFHNCDKICHPGSCGSCTEVLKLKCHCGQQEIFKNCNELSADTRKNFSCGKLCEKLLDCGKHICQERCHPGPRCWSCKLLSENIKTCPCGNTALKRTTLLERKQCTDPIPTCESKCNRPLNCGPEKNRHKCQKKCHTGPCPPCKLKTTIYCDCKQSTRTVACSMLFERIIIEDQVLYKQIECTFSCETRCNKLKICGRHRCNNKCCKFTKTQDPSLHQCDQMCYKKLQCGQHHCPEPCHPGQCGDCTNIGWEELSCHCGSSVLYPPIPCGARAPVCHNPCMRAHDCNHPIKHECHDDTEKCAPCIVFVKKPCFCGSDSKDSVYCYLPGYSCGKTCKKQLSCRQHFCQKVCHDGECEVPNERGAIFCNQACPVLRFSCKHPCSIPCHGKIPCPPSDCRKILQIQCECGNKSERVECHKVMKDVDNRNMMVMLNRTRANEDTIMIDLSKKPVTKPVDSLNLKKLDCDDSCSIFKRNKALAEALDIDQPDLKPSSLFGEDPLRLLKEATIQDYKFVAATYNSLVRFVRSAKESDKRFVFMQYPPANKLRREVIHELAHHFHCTSESREEEPFRHVVVRAYKNKSVIPDFNIEQLLPVTD